MNSAHPAVKFVNELLGLGKYNPTSVFIVQTVESIAHHKGVSPADIEAFKQKVLDGDVNVGPEVENIHSEFVAESVYVHSPIWGVEPSDSERGQRIARYRGKLQQMLSAMLG